MVMGGPSRTATAKLAMGAPHAAPGGWWQQQHAITAGGVGIVPRKASWIIAMTAHLIATKPTVAAELGMLVAAAAAAEAAGTAMEKNKGGGGNTKT
jgi:hypothetical protein